MKTPPSQSPTSIDIARMFDPARLTQARKLNRMTKADLHRRVGVSAAAISQYERGEVRPRAETIESLARALNVPPGFFSLGRPRAQIEVSQASFRRLRSTTVSQQQQATAFVEHVWELSRYLEQLVEFPALDLPEWALDESEDRPDPVTAARTLREYWNLGSQPIEHLVCLLEQRGITTVFFSMKEDDSLDEQSRIDAFSTTALPRPVIVLTPDKANDVLRHRFSAAHELGHVVLHHGRHGSDSLLEREADAFAAEFLTPRDVIRDQLPRRVNFAQYDELSQYWGVSINSLIYRAKELEIISASTARRAYIALNKMQQRPMPIEDYPGEQPELFRCALDLLYEAGVSLSTISDEMQMSPRHIRRLAGVRESQPTLTLVRDPIDRGIGMDHP